VQNPDSETQFQPDPEVVACDLAGGAALLDMRSGTYFTLNAVGAFIWDKLQPSATLDDLCRSVTSAFDIDQAQCRQHIGALLADLDERRLIRACDHVGE